VPKCEPTRWREISKYGSDMRTAAVIAGSGLSALGVMRSLGRAGIPFYNLNAQEDYVAASRWYRPVPDAWRTLDDEEPLAEGLRRLPLERAVLFTTSDDRVQEASLLEGQLAERFPSALSSAATIGALLDKLALAEMLAAHEVPRPRTFELQEERDLDGVPDDVFTSCFLKPRHSLEFNRRYRAKGIRVTSRQEARERFRRVQADGFEVILQEYIPGAASAHHFIDGFVDRHGHVPGLFARQRIRMYPALFGNSSSMISIALAAVDSAWNDVQRLLAAIGYRGIFSAELKLDPRDGVFKLLEINCRPWWFNGFASDCGVDVTLMHYHDSLGMPVEPVTHYREGVKLVSSFNDLRACRQSRTSLHRALRFWFGARDAMFSGDDPLPFFRYAGEQSARIAKGWMRRT
jgi:predicted ATP-grasp superfamily ATP-dependent carboligase